MTVWFPRREDCGWFPPESPRTLVWNDQKLHKFIWLLQTMDCHPKNVGAIMSLNGNRIHAPAEILSFGALVCQVQTLAWTWCIVHIVLSSEHPVLMICSAYTFLFWCHKYKDPVQKIDRHLVLIICPQYPSWCAYKTTIPQAQIRPAWAPDVLHWTIFHRRFLVKGPSSHAVGSNPTHGQRSDIHQAKLIPSPPIHSWEHPWIFHPEQINKQITTTLRGWYKWSVFFQYTLF